MTYKHDKLGLFLLPDWLIEKVKDYVPPVITPIADVTNDSANQLWHTVATYTATKGSAIHTVERLGNTNQFSCTCQSFRIQKKGYCKHTKKAKRELGVI